jgi:hypothetical protein
MTNEITTEAMIKMREIERQFGPRPLEIETEEQHLHWLLSKINQKAREDAEPIIQRLVDIEGMKPFTPLLIIVKDQQP